MNLEHAPQRDGKKLRTPEAARFLGLSQSTMAKMRMRGTGPVYCKAGSRLVLYDIADLQLWFDQGRRRSTSDDGEVR